MVAKLVLLYFFSVLSQAAGLQGASRPSTATGRARGWCQEPLLGEADNPGPLSGFDNEGMEAWSEDEADWQYLPGESGWLPDDDDDSHQWPAMQG